MAILQKRVFKKTIERRQEKSEILSIPNKYKDTLEDLVDSLDIEYLAITKQINLLSNNNPGFNNSSDP